jgi:TP901 family phage tail tape measure protein
MASLNKVREAMQGNIATLEQYRLRQGQVLSAEDAWQKKIREGKATFGDMYKNRKMFNTVLQEQIALQKAMGLGWTQSTKTGKFSVDMFIPKTLSTDLETARAKMGLFSQITNVASENMVNWGKNTQWAGRQLMVGFTVPLGIAAAAMGKMAYDLDKQVTQVVKVYGDASESINANADDIRSTAIQTAQAAARIYGQSAETTLGIMADLAASGKSGMELQQATMATTRAAILGELDWQDAVKATISMQEVYQAKQVDLANNWNYINAMENQTVLSAQDFVTAIPKVSGVMNELGGTLKDTGSLLTAFKAAGIDAAEGANALKTINFRLVATYGKGLETFNAKTGKDLRAIIDETNGKTIPTLMKFADAIKNLSAADKVAVTRDVFGIYQGSKALMLIDQMTQKTEQWQQALDVANNTNIENAAIAQQELDRQSERPFRKLDMAIQSIKIELGTMGEAFLGPAAGILDWVTKLIKGFNDLNPIIKQFAAGFAIALGIAGPIVMLTGLFANLLGTGLKFASRLGLLATRWKQLSEEEKLQQLISKQSVALWDAETASAARLTLEIKQLTAALVEARSVEDFTAVTATKKQNNKADRRRADEIFASKNIPAYQPIFNQDKNGRYYDPTSGRKVKTQEAIAANEMLKRSYDSIIAKEKEEALAIAKTERALRERTAQREADKIAAEEAAAAATAAEERMLKITRLVSTASLGVGIVGSMVGPKDGIGGFILNLTNAIATLGMVAPGALAKVGKGIASLQVGGKTLGAIGKGAFNGIKNTAMSMIGYLKVAGPIIAAIGVAAFILIQKWNDEIDKSRQKTEDFVNFAKNSADIFGYSYTDAAGLDPNTIKDGARATEVLAEKVKSSNPAAAAGYSEMQGRSDGEKWAAALQAGADAKLHGATSEQAKDTMRTALQLMNKTFTDQEWEAKVTFNFDDANELLNQQISAWRTQLDGAFKDKPVNWWEGVWNGGQLSQDAGVVVQKIGKDFWTQLTTLPKSDRKKVLMDFANEQDKFINDAYKAYQKRSPDAAKYLGINNAHDFSKALNQNTFSATTLGMSDDDYKALRARNDGLIQLAQNIASAANVSKEARGKIHTLWDLFQQPIVATYLGQTTTAAEKALGPTDLYDEKINEVLQSGQKLTAAKIAQIQTDLRVADGTYKLGSAVQYFGDVTRGAGIDADTFNAKLSELGFNATVTLDSISNSWKNVYSGAQDRMFEEAGRQYDEYQQAQMDALQKKGQDALDELDKKGEAADKKREKASKALDDRLDKDKKAFDKAWDDRKKREAAVYDARIQKIEDAIKAEQDAEKVRQKIFEAEQTRIQRLAQMYSTNIDINMAINSGAMDEAAKLSANADAQIAQWATSDAADASASASDKRIEDLNKQKDTVSKAKDAHMEALQAIEDAEKEAFQKRQDRQKQELKDAQDLAKKKEDAEKKRIQNENAANEKQLRDDQARDKRNLEGQLAIMRAFLPKNKQQLLDQASALYKVYDGFGIKLEGNGKKWATTVSGALGTEVAKEGNALKTTVNWANIGQEIAGAMIKGAFGMDPKTFAAWLNGGKAPDNTIFGKQTPKAKYRTQLNDPESRHSGGVIGAGGGARTGYSGTQKPGEKWVNALVGEGMVNRRGMSFLGKSGLDYINSGGGKGGGGVMGLGAGVPGTVVGTMGRVLIQSAINSAYNKRLGNDMKGQIGSKLAYKPDAANAFSDIFNAGASVAYKSGKVVYLGHGAYPGGGNFAENVRPAAGVTTSLFGPRNLLGMSFHNGLDIANATGTPIKAAQGGRVIYTGWDNTGYGNYTEIQSADGTMYGYGHQSQIGVRAGQKVNTGQLIGRMGSTGKSTGSHLHFQIGRNGVWFDPRTVMPQLNTGGLMMSDGIAKLHKEEAVLTKPLTRDLKEGVQNLADGGTVQYNVTLDFNGASFNRGIDFQHEVETVLRNMERKSGGTRTIGGKR